MRHILTAALAAAFLAGLTAFAIQSVKVVPLIAAAEVYENAAPAGAEPPAAAHSHDATAWEPAEGFERHAYTALADILVAFGFALILTGLFALRGRAVDARQGLLWGLAGFAVFALAPAFGLPPELPGSQTADLSLRQVWWLGTAIATAGGLALLVFASTVPRRALGLALLLAPHILGAPHAHEFGGTAPPELAAQFVAVSLMASAIFWVVLGSSAGWLYGRLARAAPP
jgi:cobalt transporter subunit CbtA